MSDDRRSRAATLLEARRDELNARFARGAGELSPEHMLGYLQRTVIPILDAWEGEPSAAILFALFDLGMVGLRTGLVGEAGQAPFEHGMCRHMPAFRTHVEREPGVVLRAIGNGYLHVQRERGPDVAQVWLDSLASGASQCPDRSTLLQLGVVLSWRAGLAEAREAALECATRLEPMLLARLFGSSSVVADPERRFCRPGASAKLGALELVAKAGRIGGFRGPFPRSPEPRGTPGGAACAGGWMSVRRPANTGARNRPSPVRFA